MNVAVGVIRAADTLPACDCMRSADAVNDMDCEELKVVCDTLPVCETLAEGAALDDPLAVELLVPIDVADGVPLHDGDAVSVGYWLADGEVVGVSEDVSEGVCIWD